VAFPAIPALASLFSRFGMASASRAGAARGSLPTSPSRPPPTAGGRGPGFADILRGLISRPAGPSVSLGANQGGLSRFGAQPMGQAARSLAKDTAYQNIVASAMTREQESGIQELQEQQLAQEQQRVELEEATKKVRLFGLRIFGVTLLLAAMPKIIKRLTNAQVEQQKSLERYGGQIAVASLVLEAERIGREVKVARATGPSTQKLFQAQSALEEELLPTRTVWTELKNRAMIGLAHVARIAVDISQLSKLAEAAIAFTDAMGGDITDMRAVLEEDAKRGMVSPRPEPIRRRLSPEGAAEHRAAVAESRARDRAFARTHGVHVDASVFPID